MPFLDPALITDKHKDIVKRVMCMDDKHLAMEWYRWMYERWTNDPLHMEGSIRRRLHKFHDEFAKARLRGEL